MYEISLTEITGPDYTCPRKMKKENSWTGEICRLTQLSDDDEFLSSFSLKINLFILDEKKKKGLRHFILFYASLRDAAMFFVL